MRHFRPRSFERFFILVRSVPVFQCSDFFLWVLLSMDTVGVSTHYVISFWRIPVFFPMVCVDIFHVLFVGWRCRGDLRLLLIPRRSQTDRLARPSVQLTELWDWDIAHLSACVHDHSRAMSVSTVYVLRYMSSRVVRHYISHCLLCAHTTTT